MPSATVSPAVAGPRFSRRLAEQLEHAGDAAGLAVSGEFSVVPSPIWPVSTRATDILPPCAVCRVLSTQRDRLVAGLDAEAPGGVGDARRLVAQRLQQPQHAVGARRRPHQHRADQPVAQFLGEIVEHLVARRRDVVEQLLHQLVVVVGERLQHGEARVLLAVRDVALERHDLGWRVLLVDMGALEREIDEAGDDVVRSRSGSGAAPAARATPAAAASATRARAVSALSILLRNRKRGNFQVFELAQDQLELRNLLLVGLADHDRGVDRRQRPRACRGTNSTEPGTIDEGVAVAHERRGGDRQLDAHLVLARFLAGVADGGAGLDRALPLDRAGAGQDRFEQRGLAALERAHQRDAPGTRRTRAISVACPPPSIEIARERSGPIQDS